MTTKQAAGIIKMLLGYLKGEIEPPKQETIEEAKAFEQQPCEDWYDVPSDELTLEQAKQAVKDLRKKLREYLDQEPCEDAVSRQAVHDLIAELLSDYLHDEDREKIEELDVKIEDLEPVTPKEKSEYEHDHEVVKAYNDGQAYILDKIRAEIDQKQYDFMSDGDYNEGIRFGLMLAYQIIDKYNEVNK